MGNDMTKTEKPCAFDWGMHNLRAFAIVCILFEHFANFTGLLEVSRAFLTGSTVFFLFISGYLCQHLATHRPVSAKTYFRRKVTNVICPYLVWSMLTVFAVRITGTIRYGVIAPDEICWKSLPEIFLFGWAQGPYWYIPFVCVLFLVSPWLTRIGNPDLVRVSFVAFALAICIPVRSSSHLDGNLVPFAMQYSCFAWSYLFGFLYSRFKSSIDRQLSGYVGPALLLGILLGLQFLQPEWFLFAYRSFDAPVPYTRSFVLGGSLAQSLQKLCFLVPAVVLANRFSEKRVAVLDWLATHSFTLYFTHHFFVQDFSRMQNWLFIVTAPGPIGRMVFRLLLFAVFVAFNLILAMGLKKAFGRYSRCFIGS